MTLDKVVGGGTRIHRLLKNDEFGIGLHSMDTVGVLILTSAIYSQYFNLLIKILFSIIEQLQKEAYVTACELDKIYVLKKNVM